MGSTTISAIPYPETLDPTTIPAQLRAAFEVIARSGVPRFATTAERTAAYATLGITPDPGSVCYLASAARIEIYDATLGWGPIPAVPLYAVKTADDTRTTTTYATDTHLTMSVPRAGTYDIKLTLYYNGPSGGANGRLKVRFNFPAGALSMGHVGGINNAPGGTANFADVDLGSVMNATSSPTSDFLLPTVGVGVPCTAVFEGTLVNTAAGTFSVDTAQIVASGTTTIGKHSKLLAQYTAL